VLYVGPEIMMPVVSALAAIGGVLLIFWRRVKAAFRAIFRFVTGRPAPPPPTEPEVPSEGPTL
jgi:hypothetical protein